MGREMRVCLHFFRSECSHDVPAFCAPITKKDNSNTPHFSGCLFLAISCMDGNDGPGFMRLTMLLLASSPGFGCGLFRVIDRDCWFAVSGALLCGKADGTETGATTAFDLNEASMEAKSLIFIKGYEVPIRRPDQQSTQIRKQ